MIALARPLRTTIMRHHTRHGRHHTRHGRHHTRHGRNTYQCAAGDF